MSEYGYVLFVMSTSERAYPDSGSILTLQCGYITRELLMLGAMAALRCGLTATQSCSLRTYFTFNKETIYTCIKVIVFNKRPL